MKSPRSLFTLIFLLAAGYLYAEKDQPKKVDCKAEEIAEVSIAEETTDLMAIQMPSNTKMNELSKTRWEDSLLDSNLNVDEPDFAENKTITLRQDQSLASTMKK